MYLYIHISYINLFCLAAEMGVEDRAAASVAGRSFPGRARATRDNLRTHQCLVETWSFMDQLFPFWFNSPCDWFSARECWKISAPKRALKWGIIWIQMRGGARAPATENTLGARRQLQVDYVASDKKLQLFCSRCRYLHLNAYCRNLNSIKTDCKCQLLGCVWGRKKEKEFQ